VHGTWQPLNDAAAAAGSALWNVDAGQPKVAPALAAPANFFETTFTAAAGKPYHLWIRMRSQNNAYANDSIHVQFSDAVTSTGTPTMRLGSTSPAESCCKLIGGCRASGWGWADNGWDVPGTGIPKRPAPTRFIQQREDGAIVDQIVRPDSFSARRRIVAQRRDHFRGERRNVDGSDGRHRTVGTPAAYPAGRCSCCPPRHQLDGRRRFPAPASEPDPPSQHRR
jgi:hypothetical protein